MHFPCKSHLERKCEHRVKGKEHNMQTINDIYYRIMSNQFIKFNHLIKRNVLFICNKKLYYLLFFQIYP